MISSKERSIMVTSASKGVRVAAGIVCAFFAVFVLFHLLWAVGVTWGLEEMFPGQPHNDASLALTVASLVGAAAGAAVIFVTISRVGWHKTRLPDRLLHIGAWVVFAWPSIGSLNPSTTWGMRAVTVPLAIAALVVARSRPRRQVGKHHGIRSCAHPSLTESGAGRDLFGRGSSCRGRGPGVSRDRLHTLALDLSPSHRAAYLGRSDGRSEGQEFE
jgi:hypothetical protein